MSHAGQLPAQPERQRSDPTSLLLLSPNLSLTERWLLTALAARPGLSRRNLQLEVDLALGALLRRGEIRRGDGESLVLNLR